MGKTDVINDFLHYRSVPAGTSGERTIYGDKEDDLFYAYDDRLYQWDYEKAKSSREEVLRDKKIKPHTCAFYEKWLSLYYSKPIDLRHILIGVNVSSGFQYMVFGFLEKTPG
jgi:hypothetical protein